MMATLSRADRRRMQRFADANEPTIEADRRFFARRPDRQFRVRRMSRAELEQLEIACGAPLMPLAPGSAPFTVIKQLAPCVRLRAFIPGPADEDGSSASDVEARWLWEPYADTFPGVREREAALCEAMAQPGGPLHREGGR